jgi:Raf kinase inhibitor-like YbhB/YbcL family protein
MRELGTGLAASLLLLALALAAGCSGTGGGEASAAAPAAPAEPEGGGEEESAMILRSEVFEDGGEIPTRYTCEGEDLSPPLAWEGVPEGTVGLALIVDDPDAPDPEAPRMVWVHWVLYNLPPDSTGLPEAVAEDALPDGTLPGLNDWKRTGYGGPCPPIGRHRYFHKLYALDTVLPDLGRPTKAGLLEAMEGHVLAEVQLVGTYRKKG